MNFSQRSILQNQNIHSRLHSPPTSRLILQLFSFLSFPFYLGLMINCQGPLSAAAASHAQNKLTVAPLTCDFLAGGYSWETGAELFSCLQKLHCHHAVRSE